MKESMLYFILLTTSIFTISCSKDSSGNGSDNSEILTAYSPWKFERFELLQILEKENDTITEKEVERIVNDTYQNLAFIFKEDGTGVTRLRNDEPFTWTWAYSGEDKICFDGICDDESMTAVEVTSESLRFELIAASPEDANGNSTMYIGKYFFK